MGDTLYSEDVFAYYQSVPRIIASALSMALSVAVAWFLCRALDAFLPRRRSRFLRLCLLLVFSFAMQGPFWIGDENSLYLLPFFLAAILLCFGGPLPARLAMAAILYPLFMSVGMMIDSLPDLSKQMNVLFDAITDGIKLACWTGIVLYFRRIAPKDGSFQLSRRMWGLVAMLSLAPLFGQMTFVVGWSGWYELTDQTQAVVTNMAYTVLPFVALSALALLYALRTLSNYERLSRERQITELGRSYYEQLEQQQRQVRRLRHDMANHLETLSGLPPEDKDAYLAQLLDSPALKPGRKYCENHVANVIFTAKAAQAEQDGTPLTLEASLPEQLPLEEMDLCALLSNALDNALEACRKLPEAQRRVALRLRADKGMLVLRMENPCAEPARRVGRKFLSSKPDPEQHGLGTESIRSVVHKYGGSVNFTQRDGMFEVLLYIPLNRPAP